jgi:osmoprotectant transport system ATP-binding protein
MIRLDGVTKQFEDETAVDALDLDVPSRTTTVLIGPSGCGKSTILRLVVALEQADAGRILIDDRPLEAWDIGELRTRIGYVIQGGGLFPHMTARANITVMADHLGWDEQRTHQRVEHLRELTHLESEQLARYPAQLSGGQKQRVALMRALMLDPEVLLLDEPLGALDPMIRARLQDELRDIFDALDKTVVLVTHDMQEAAHFAGTVALLRDGRLVQAGTVDDLVQRPADPFVTEFIRAQGGGPSLQTAGEDRA